MADKVIITGESTTAPAEPKQKTVTLQGKKIVPTSGIFLISNDKGDYKYVGCSTRIEVCIKDYFKWLSDGKHGNTDMQKAYNANGNRLNSTILKTCPKESFTTEKALACKEHGVAMKVPFSKDVIEAKDIKV
jgi:hypothetical protein